MKTYRIQLNSYHFSIKFNFFRHCPVMDAKEEFQELHDQLTLGIFVSRLVYVTWGNQMNKSEQR